MHDCVQVGMEIERCPRAMLRHHGPGLHVTQPDLSRLLALPSKHLLW